MDISNSNISLEEAIKLAKENEIIYLGNRSFKEKILLNKPNITLIGNDALITNDLNHGKINPITNKKYGTTGSATFTVQEKGYNFKAIGITFENSYKRIINKDGQAVAFKSETSNVTLERCQFIGCQDTLYLDNGININVNNCYICGDIDFIFGSSSVNFNNCYIKIVNDGYFLAPDTYITFPYGFNFNNCYFKANRKIKAYLGRPWYPGGALQEVKPQVVLNNCKLSSNIILELLQMHKQDKIDYKLILNNCYYKNKIINKDLSKSL